MKKNILSKAIILAIALVFMISPMMVSANAGIHAQSLTVADVTAEDVHEVEETAEEVSYGALTPEGNLKLVDDYGSLQGAGKQFITVETKSGTYFYIIIDRDDNGMEKVHFLNKVEEEDLLAVMEPEDVQEYLEESQEVQTVPMDEEESQEETETEEPELKEEDPVVVGLPPLTSLLLIGGMFGVSGIGGYFYIRRNKKIQLSNADTRDEEDEVLEDLEEMEFDDEDLDAEEEEE